MRAHAVCFDANGVVCSSECDCKWSVSRWCVAVKQPEAVCEAACRRLYDWSDMAARVLAGMAVANR